MAGTTFADVVTLYNFDRELRVLCLDAIERIEVALRASIVNELAVAHGPHFYLDPRHFNTAESYRSFFSKAVQAVSGDNSLRAPLQSSAASSNLGNL